MQTQELWLGTSLLGELFDAQRILSLDDDLEETQDTPNLDGSTFEML